MIFDLLFLGVFVVVALVGWVMLHRHGESGVAADHWRRTDELFRDPSSGRLMRVWIDSADGSRHYVPDGDGPTG
jgi:preprotein translocase subunit SecG